jgi:O-acetyl-ADP-ribose deacetylase (regulator of RNase III)
VAGAAGARSIAFPAISTGAFGFPGLRAAEVAVRAVREADPARWDRIVLTAYDARTLTWYRRLLGSDPTDAWQPAHPPGGRP